jgi:hypothetical protein
VDWQSSSPVQINLRIRGLNHYANYTAPSVAVVDHYDPFLRAVVREYFVIGGGQAASDVSFVTGGSADGSVHGMGQAKVAIYSLGGAPFGAFGSKSWGPIGRFLEKVGEISDAIDGPTNTVAYSITDMGGGVVDPNSPGFIESRQRSLSRKVILQQDDYAYAGRGFDTPRELLGARPAMESWHPKKTDQNFASPAFKDRSDNPPPAETFDRRWRAIPDPALRTAQAWLDLSRNPASGNLNPTLSPGQSPQEGRRLQDIGVQDTGVVGSRDEDLPAVLPLPRSAPPWLNLESTPLGGFRPPGSSNIPADVWKDAFVSPAMPGNFFPIRTMVFADNGGAALDPSDGRSPIAQDTTFDSVTLLPMKRLADLGRPDFDRPDFGRASGTGGLGEYDYRGFYDDEFDDDEFRRR